MTEVPANAEVGHTFVSAVLCHRGPRKMRMRTSTSFVAWILASLFAAGCGTDLDFGNDAVVRSDPGSREPSDRANASPAPGLPGGPSASPDLTPCPTGRLCWATPLP